ncbi:glycoside hydrolase family 88/105 protein [Metabacillus malikii]|uniref:Unsaturated rhamnogalacturonyl hydrolase n=1 Tax=Metabacillus malikii TaxID=1504265 RepID=A0ABT9ZD50_9BACI|nr:glycoside hydrolase family 88 protein [Metabacillus malikii]MDQ0229864.1 unsaturated rhamnogalacturonyl hydrolase [Metabacillus malikii]
MGNTVEQISVETPLIMAEKACQALMQTFRAEELPPVNAFHYHQGVFLYGMYRVYQATGKKEYFDYIKAYYDSLIDEFGNVCFARDELDSTMAGILLFPLYEETKDPKYMIAAKRLRSALDTLNRTSENGFWHKEKYPYQMWLDGLFMGGPFMLLYSQHFHEEELIQTVLLQEKLMRKHMLDEHTRLLYHAWDEKKAQPWANKETGCSPEFWGRSVGWYGTALIDLLEILGDRSRGQEQLITSLKDFIPAIAKFQDDQTGLWYQIVDKGEQGDNWLESSCSALFLYFIAKGIQHGYVDHSYRAVVDKAYKGLLEHMVDENESKLILSGICIGTSAGVYDYYVNRPTSENDLHGMGAFILGSMAYYDLLKAE